MQHPRGDPVAGRGCLWEKENMNNVWISTKKLCDGIGLLIWSVHPTNVGCRSEKRLGLRGVKIALSLKIIFSVN